MQATVETEKKPQFPAVMERVLQYELQRDRARAALIQIGGLLDDHAASADPVKNWGWIGDLGHVNNKLAAIIVFMEGGED